MSGKGRAGGEVPRKVCGERGGESASGGLVPADGSLVPSGPDGPDPAEMGADEVVDLLSSSEAADRLRSRLTQLAWKRYSIRADAAEDVIQNAVAAYLEVRGRYEKDTNSTAILYGIFFRKCLEYISASVREDRRMRRYCVTPDAARENAWIHPDRPGQAPSVLSELIDREDASTISGAFEKLRPNSRRLAWLITQRGMKRQELIEHLGVNPNTLDSRLLACRKELRSLLGRRDIAV